MERGRCSPAYTQNYIRSPNSSCVKTSFNSRLEEFQLQDGEFSSNVRTNSFIKATENFGKTTSKRFQSQLYFKNVFEKENFRRTSTDFRFERTERACSSEEIQSHFSFSNPKLSTGWRLDGKNRLQPSLFSYSDSKVSSQPPSSCLQGGAASDDELALWPLIRTLHFRDDSELDCRDPSLARCKSDRLSRRLPSGLSRQSQVDISNTRSTEIFEITGLDNQNAKVHPRPLSGDRISRPDLEHSFKSYSVTKRQGEKDYGIFGESFSGQELFPKTTAELIRKSKLCQLRYPPGSTTLSSPTTISGEFPTRKTAGEMFYRLSNNSRAELVEGSFTHNISTAQETNHTLSHDGRCGYRMGSSTKQQPHIRFLDESSNAMALEQEGTVYSLLIDKGIFSRSSRCACSDSVRQSYPCCLYQQGGRHSFDRTSRFNTPNSRDSRLSEHNIDGRISTRQIQLYSRPTFEKEIFAGVASHSRGEKYDFQDLGYSGSRLICIGEVCGSRSLCLNRFQGPSSSVYRCIQQDLEFPIGMGVPPSESNSKSFGTFKQVSRSVRNNCTQVESNILDVGSDEQKQTTSDRDTRLEPTLNRPVNRTTTQQSGSTYSSSVDGWVWTDLTKNWSPEEIKLLKQSWRKSTLNTYKAPLKRWIDWCTLNKINPGNPSGSDLARFLASLFITNKLAYNTILLHKSAISTFCSGGPSTNLSSDFLVQQILKAISIAKPVENKKVIWDAQILMNWLAAEPIKQSLFEISRRTAALLLLVSGRRIHDLTLLKISEGYFQKTTEEIILWPSFGSKTDRSSFRQSGWRLLKHPNKWLCPIYLINSYLNLSSERRKNVDEDPLFVAIIGKKKAASSTVIANWIRSVLKDAGVNDSPGSVRSAVASRAWLDNLPIQDILDHGNWRCVETFRNHYCKEVQKNNNSSSLLSKNFECI